VAERRAIARCSPQEGRLSYVAQADCEGAPTCRRIAMGRTASPRVRFAYRQRCILLRTAASLWEAHCLGRGRGIRSRSGCRAEIGCSLGCVERGLPTPLPGLEGATQVGVPTVHGSSCQPIRAVTTYPDVAACLRATDSAWECWRSGFALGQDVYLLGWRLIWWARLGRLLQFVSAAFIVLEILGPDRLAGMSEVLQRWNNWLTLAAGWLNDGARRLGDRLFHSVPQSLAGWLALILGGPSIVVVSYGLWNGLGLRAAFDAFVRQAPYWVIAALVCVAALYAAALALIFGPTLLGVAAARLAGASARGLAYLVGHPSVSTGAKLLSFIMFFLGFSLDFAAS
jgi:hypothetical protein